MSLAQPRLEAMQTSSSRLKHAVTSLRMKTHKFITSFELAARDVMPAAVTELMFGTDEPSPDEPDFSENETSCPDSVGLVEAYIQSVSPTETISSWNSDTGPHISLIPGSLGYTSSMDEGTVTVHNIMEGFDRQFEPTCPLTLIDEQFCHAACVAKPVRVTDHNSANEYGELQPRKQIPTRATTELRSSSRPYEISRYRLRSDDNLVRSARNGWKSFRCNQHVDIPVPDTWRRGTYARRASI